MEECSFSCIRRAKTFCSSVICRREIDSRCLVQNILPNISIIKELYLRIIFHSPFSFSFFFLFSFFPPPPPSFLSRFSHDNNFIQRIIIITRSTFHFKRNEISNNFDRCNIFEKSRGISGRRVYIKWIIKKKKKISRFTHHVG